jgi:plastocyanin
MRSLRHLSLLTAIPAVLTALACGGGGGGTTAPTTEPSPAQVTVHATDAMAFTPNSVTVRPGGKVEFEFGSVAHTVVFAAIAGAPAEIPSSASTTVERAFASAGTFAYHCTIHPGMGGTVIVAEKSTTRTGGQGCGSYYGC